MPRVFQDALDEIDAAIDRERIFSGAQMVARALDENVPILQARATARKAGTTEEGSGCNVVDRPPVLCIGGAEENTYVENYHVVIDLGGDDLHLQAAGAADPLRGGLASSVTVDIGGDDDYRASVPHPNGSFAAQGQGVAGIGFLLDTSGNDEYSVSSRAGEWTVEGQGTGVLGGVGLLADTIGDDRYTLSDRNESRVQGFYDSVIGAGTGTVGGLGILLDLSGGSDTYLLEGHPEPGIDLATGKPLPGNPSAAGVGYGAVGGTGLFVDEGGADTLSISSDNTEPAETSLGSNPGLQRNGYAHGYGVGVGEGKGVAIFGPGPTTRSMHLHVRAPRSNLALETGFGAGLYSSVGMLFDAGGVDRNIADAIIEGQDTVELRDGCVCKNVTATAETGLALVEVQGSGSSGSVGLVHDVNGNDVYLSSAQARAVARVLDERDPSGDQAAEPIHATVTAQTGDAVSASQGFGANGFYSTGPADLFSAGFLIDDSGDDVYDSRAATTADASVEGLTDGFSTIESGSGYGVSLAMGASSLTGHGDFRDMGGSDRYLTSNASAAVANPSGTAESGSPLSFVLAGVNLAGNSFFYDGGGESDVFTALPTNPACSGTRGEDVWVDCVPAGIGVNRAAPFPSRARLRWAWH